MRPTVLTKMWRLVGCSKVFFLYIHSLTRTLYYPVCLLSPLSLYRSWESDFIKIVVTVSSIMMIVVWVIYILSLKWCSWYWVWICIGDIEYGFCIYDIEYEICIHDIGYDFYMNDTGCDFCFVDIKIAFSMNIVQMIKTMNFDDIKVYMLMIYRELI